jgi:hypothetical protein
MRLFNKIYASCLVLALIGFSINVQAQCKGFAKKYCLPSIAPFIHNGQLTNALFNPGDSADIEMSFNAGKEYRIVVCSQEMIGNVQFKVLDKTRKVLYKSDPDQTNPFWDFKVANTQPLIVQITVPPADNTKNPITRLTPNGCVALLVGFKE